jgi:hypothetical protein
LIKSSPLSAYSSWELSTHKEDIAGIALAGVAALVALLKLLPTS